MPKMKTHRAAAKRFKKTAHGGFKSGSAFTSHRFHGKTKKQRRQLRGTSMMDATTVKTYAKMLYNL
ncbi:MAG TPA: 50S ribosomal protein L35 [Lactobacillaceae bacterium]|jgi:large subunit ribosomal protein L35